MSAWPLTSTDDQISSQRSKSPAEGLHQHRNKLRVVTFPAALQKLHPDPGVKVGAFTFGRKPYCTGPLSIIEPSIPARNRNLLIPVPYV